MLCLLLVSDSQRFQCTGLHGLRVSWHTAQDGQGGLEPEGSFVEVALLLVDCGYGAEGDSDSGMLIAECLALCSQSLLVPVDGFIRFALCRISRGQAAEARTVVGVALAKIF